CESEEHTCGAPGLVRFDPVLRVLQGSLPLWDDLVSKGGKLQTQLRATLAAVASFLDAFQRVADAASGSRGAMQDLGAALTRLCLRHRSVLEAFADHLVAPLQEQMDDWKKNTQSLDKDHHKECKKLRQELKKRSSDSLKLQKKNKKGLETLSVLQYCSTFILVCHFA
uniref:IMD domain-containing protein n=1 Tax=Neogobius melanostomus TaxID=47308 RepID=A0A8C6TU24_9GOBI